MDHPLLTGSGHSRADWEKAAADVLRKRGRMAPEDPDDVVWRKLTRTTLDGIEVPPLALPDDLRGLPDTGLPGAAPFTRGSLPTPPEHGWDVRSHLADPDPTRAAADALLDLENGVAACCRREKHVPARHLVQLRRDLRSQLCHLGFELLDARSSRVLVEEQLAEP